MFECRFNVMPAIPRRRWRFLTMGIIKAQPRQRRTPLLFLVLGLLAATVSLAVTAADLTRNDKTSNPRDAAVGSEVSFQAKLPDGLYLFQGWFHGAPVYETAVGPHTGEDIYPLFIVEKGELRDPYVLTSRLGVQTFFEKYVRNMTFDVYKGEHLVRRLKNYQIRACSQLSDKTLGPMMRGSFVQSGVAETVKMVRPREPKEKWQYYPYPTPKAVFTPGRYLRQLPETLQALTGTDLEKMQRLFDNQIKKSRDDGTKNDLEIDLFSIRAMALDIDGNGIKDLLAIYSYTLKPKNGSSAEKRFGQQTFILWGSGQAENIAVDVGGELLPGGVIDIDQDGFLEIIVTEEFESQHVPGSTGGKFYVFHRGLQGWRQIYQTTGFNLNCSKESARTYK